MLVWTVLSRCSRRIEGKTARRYTILSYRIKARFGPLIPCCVLDITRLSDAPRTHCSISYPALAPLQRIESFCETQRAWPNAEKNSIAEGKNRLKISGVGLAPR